MNISEKIISIVESVLDEEMTLDDYIKVVENILPKEAAKSQKRFYETVVKWAMRVLKKNNRIIWFLRWYAFRLSYKFLEDKKFTYDKLKDIVRSFSDKSGIEIDKVMDSILAFDVDEILGKLEHFFDENTVNLITKIRNYSFQYQTPEQVLSDFSRFEDEYRSKTSGGLDPKVLIRPDQFEKGAKKILEFPDGYAWWDLNTNTSREESRSGNNCGTCEFADSTLLSLRRPIKIGGETWWKSELTAELTDRNTIRQLRHGNNKPENIYHPYIMKLLLNQGLSVSRRSIDGFEHPDYLPTDTFSVGDLSGSEFRELEDNNSDLVSEPANVNKTYFQLFDSISDDTKYLDATSWPSAIEEAKEIIKGYKSDIFILYTMYLQETDRDGDDYGGDTISEKVGDLQKEPPCTEPNHNWVENKEVTDKVSENIPINIVGIELHIQTSDPEVCSNCGRYRSMVNEDSIISPAKGNWPDNEEIKRTIDSYWQLVYTEADVISKEWIESLRR